MAPRGGGAQCKAQYQQPRELSAQREGEFLSWQGRETEASLLPSIFEWLYLRSTSDEKKLLSEPKTIENEESYISTNDWQRDRGARRAIQVLAGCQ